MSNRSPWYNTAALPTYTGLVVTIYGPKDWASRRSPACNESWRIWITSLCDVDSLA